MGFHVSSYVAYGILVGPVEGASWWELREGRSRDEAVMLLEAGQYDDDDLFLAISETFKEIEPGQPVFIGPYQGSEERYLAWDGLLVATAEELKLPVTGQPAWIFIPDRS